MRKFPVLKVKQVMEAGHDCEFVDGPPKELHSECSICLLILRQPYIVDCCGNHFCKACLDGVCKVDKVCPLCKQKQFTAIPNKGLERVLNQRKVYCPNKKSGCDWTGELRQLDSHLSIPAVVSASSDNVKPPTSIDKELQECCQFVEVRCRNCPATLRRNEMTKHLDVCPNRPIPCKYCKKYTSTPEDLVQNHQSVCQKFPVPCPNKCGAKIQRKNVAKHVDSTCPQSKLPCEYSHVGCTVVLARTKMENHLKSASGMAAHLSLMEKAYAAQKRSGDDKLAEQVRSLEDKISELQMDHFRQVRALKDEVTRQRAEIKRLGGENQRLKAKLDEFHHFAYSDDSMDDEDVCDVGVAAKPYNHVTRPSNLASRPSYDIAKPPRPKSSYATAKPTDSDKEDALGWGTALGILGVGLAGAAGVAALVSGSSSDKKKKKNDDWF